MSTGQKGHSPDKNGLEKEIYCDKALVQLYYSPSAFSLVLTLIHRVKFANQSKYISKIYQLIPIIYSLENFQ